MGVKWNCKGERRPLPPQPPSSVRWRSDEERWSVLLDGDKGEKGGMCVDEETITLEI
jgi:hypothetical protein